MVFLFSHGPPSFKAYGPDVLDWPGVMPSLLMTVVGVNSLVIVGLWLNSRAPGVSRRGWRIPQVAPALALLALTAGFANLGPKLDADLELQGIWKARAEGQYELINAAADPREDE